jgi:RND family efflux transporter MFP subunit
MRTICLGFTLALVACHSTSAIENQGPPSMRVRLQTLAPTKVRDFSEYIATLKSRRSIVLQPQVEGQLRKIFVKSGAVVEAGAPIMQIDPARQAATVVNAQASRASHVANMNYAKEAYERAKRLYEGGAVSQQELDQAKAAWSSAEAQGDALGAQIRETQVQLDYYRIVAPARGTVGDIPVRVGDYVTPQTKLTTLDQNDLLEAYISVPVERADALRPDLEVQLIDSTGATLSDGKVSFISPQVTEETQSVLVKTLASNEGDRLRSAQFVRARIVWNTHDGLVVPALAVVRVNGQTFAYVAVQDGGKLVAKQRPVALGELMDGQYVVNSGLAAGDRLVVGGVQHVHDGAPIAPAKDAPAKD